MSLLTDSSTRRSEQDHEAARIRDQEYRAHAATIDRYLAANFGTALSADEREAVRQQAFVGLASEIHKGVEIENTEAMLITCARHAAYSVLRSADRRRRKPFDPHDSAEARLPDGEVPLDVAVAEADEDRRFKLLMEQLDDRSRAVLQLRLELELDMPEIADHLGVERSYAYKLLKRAGRALADSLAANDDGAHSRQQRALLAACEMGTATDDERERAKRLLEGDAHARALLAEMRGRGHQAAALMPPMAIGASAPPSSGRISHMLSSVKQYVSDLAGRSTSAQETATQVAASGGLRGSGAVGNFVVAGVLACVGAGGGYAVTVCVDQGPAALVDKIRGPDNGSKPEPPEQVVEAPVAPVIEPLTTVPDQAVAQPAETTPADAAPDAAAASEPGPAPPTASDSVSGLSGDPTATPAPAPPPPPAAPGGGSGGGGGGGSSGTTFGGL